MPSPSDDGVVGGQKRGLGRRVCLLFLFLNLGEAESACQLQGGRRPSWGWAVGLGRELGPGQLPFGLSPGYGGRDALLLYFRAEHSPQFNYG